MIGLSPKFPLQIDDYVGAYSLNTTLKEVVKQNFINLMLTVPGERIADIEFGVGLRKYLFELNTTGLQDQIASDIQLQTAKYMPFVSLGSVSFNKSQLLDGYQDQILIISITFSVPSIGMDEEIVEIGSAVQTL
jgi:phage baseplate assembly protein W